MNDRFAPEAAVQAHQLALRKATASETQGNRVKQIVTKG
jgi:hypothetical protein